jgi:hypothetical protein
MKRIKFICCDVFARLACHAAAASPGIVDVAFLPMLSHTEPKKLHEDIQALIDGVDRDIYERIVLGFGLCGNATAYLTAALPLTLPRIHDCCTMYMGSRERFREVFGENLSMRWCSCGYYERCHMENYWGQDDNYRLKPEYLQLQEKYGEENADYVWEAMHPPMETSNGAYIQLDGFEQAGGLEYFSEEMERLGKGLIVTKGSTDWFFRLVNGPWDEQDFLTIQPGQWIKPVYDMEEVVRAELAD